MHPIEIRTPADALPAALAAVAADGGGPVQWWVSEPTADTTDVATRHSLVAGRDLLQLRVPLPTDAPKPIALRPFVVGQDEDDWLAVNNRAFAAHTEQGGWTWADVVARESEPWFDADGFLLHHDPVSGRLAGFVWTKVHERPERLGEIYVIATDPDFAGQGLGRALTLAGLDHLHARRGLSVGMLYVDADNVGAVHLYESIGFTLHHTDRAFVGTVPATP